MANTHIAFADLKRKRVQFKDKRAYECQDAPNHFVPSMTTILDCYPKGAQFYQMIKKHGENVDLIFAEAMERGSDVHNLTEILDAAGSVNVMDDNGVCRYDIKTIEQTYKYKEFRDRYPFKLKDNETSYGSLELGFGGTIDRVFEDADGNLWLMDLKTGGVYDYYWLQLEGYRRLYNQYNRPEIAEGRIAIIHLDAKTRTERDWQGKGWQILFPERTAEDLWSDFQATKRLFHRTQPNFTPKNRIFDAVISLKENEQNKY